MRSPGLHVEPTIPSARTPSDPSARTPSDPSARTPSDPSARTPSDPSARTPSDPWVGWTTTAGPRSVLPPSHGPLILRNVRPPSPVRRVARRRASAMGCGNRTSYPTTNCACPTTSQNHPCRRNPWRMFVHPRIDRRSRAAIPSPALCPAPSAAFPSSTMRARPSCELCDRSVQTSAPDRPGASQPDDARHCGSRR